MEMIKSMKVSNYKNIGETKIGFDDISNFNILIGRNNIGKSTLLQILDIVMSEDKNRIKELGDAKIYFSINIGDVSLPSKYFPEDKINEIEQYLKNSEWFGKKITFIYGKHLTNDYYAKFYEIDTHEIEEIDFSIEDLRKYFDTLGEFVWDLETSSAKSIKLVAERDLVAEGGSANRVVSINGTGATNLIRQYLHIERFDNNIVEKNILDALNQIMQPEERFSAILCQDISKLREEELWEILLVNQNGKIRISESGSGLKTILLVLIKLFLESDSKIVKNDVVRNKVIYIFEELENNLHPSIQRNLFKFMYDWSIKNDTCVFLTTHSNIPLNMFGGKNSVSITHLSKVNGKLQTNSDLSFIKNENILMDLGVRASDILQSNAVIWVEGPSDRVYLNKWIELYSDGKLKENIHYQILFYGGRLLSHLSGKIIFSEDLIQLFRANRHSIIMIDSDKKNQNNKINKTKQRIKKEFEGMNSLCWITKGKEIENYLTKTTVFKTFGVNSQIERYESFEEFLNRNNEKKKEGTKYIRKKVEGAVSLCNNMTREDLKILDLEKKIELIVDKIKEWNGI